MTQGPEKLPNLIRSDDEDQGGPGSGPWYSNMALSPIRRLDGPLYSGQFVQTYAIIVVGGEGAGTGAGTQANS